MDWTSSRRTNLGKFQATLQTSSVRSTKNWRTNCARNNQSYRTDEYLVSQGVQEAMQSHATYPPPVPYHTANIETADSASIATSNPSIPGLASANSATSTITQDATIISMKAQMEMLQNMILRMQQGTVHNNASNPGPQPHATQSRNSRAPQSQHNYRNPNQQKYCHTHGACNHHSRDCRSKADGHNDDATFNNRLSGSTRNINL